MQEKFKKIYELYNQKRYIEAKKLVDEILFSDPNNIYAKRYVSLLNPLLKSTHSKAKNGTIAKVKGKKLTCPHCNSAIALSALNSEQKQKIRENNYQNLSLKCPYCHTIFTLQKRTLHSVLKIKIGDTINYNKKTYKTVGAVEYTGEWIEGNYGGPLKYLEWILLGSDNSYLYFSEGYFLDDGYKNYEYEFSEKITPDFNFSVNYDDGYIEIDNKKVKFSEKNIVFAKKLYGENSKVFEVGEKVELFECTYGGIKYVLEKEKVGRQAEVGIYKTKNVSKNVAANYFGKEIKNNFSYSSNLRDWVWVFVVGSPFLIFNSYIDENNFGAIILMGMIIVIFGIISYSVFFGDYSLKMKKLALVLFIGPIFAFFIVSPIGNLILNKKEQIRLEEIQDGQKFEIEFKKPSLRTEFVKTRKTYDYGGVRTFYESKGGLKFSVKTQEDKKIIEKIKSLDDTNSRIYEMFKEKIYKLR